MSQREQQVIVNAASPAIDRAKAKIEFLFRSDDRFPAGVPSSDVLADLMLPQLGTEEFAGYTGRVRLLNQDDPYTLPGETRVDINDDGLLDNAWSYTTDIDGDGEVTADEIVVYSILVDDLIDSRERTDPSDEGEDDEESEDFVSRPLRPRNWDYRHYLSRYPRQGKCSGDSNRASSHHRGYPPVPGCRCRERLAISYPGR